MFPFEKKANPASSTAGTLSAAGVNVIVKQGVVANDVLVAHFRADGRFQPANNYKATISWGDDTPPTPGVITPSNDWSDGASSMIGISAWSNDSFCVTGSHIYATAGRFSIGVTVYAERGSSTLVSTNALIGSLNERFIAQAYLDLLHHTIDQHRLSRWSQLLDYGTTRSQVVLEILNTKEYRKYLVESLYRLFLHQPANSKQLKHGLQSLESGITFTQFKANILSSQEYFQKRGLETNEGFLAALYIDVMGRAIAPHEALNWSQKLEEGESRATIAEAVLKSLEAELNVVRSYCQQFLQQTADNRILSTAFDALRHGELLEKVIAHILGSDEYLYSSVGTRLFPGDPRLFVNPILEVDPDFNNPYLGQAIPLDHLGKVSPLWASALVGGKTFLRNEQPEFEWVPIFSPYSLVGLVDLEFTWTNHLTSTPPFGEADIEVVNRIFNESDFHYVRLVGVSGTAVISPGTIPDPNDPNKQIPDPHPEISKNDIPFTHPFGKYDFEFDLAPDVRFWDLLAITDLDLTRCGLGWFDVEPNVRDALSIANDPNGLNLGEPGVIHTEIEQGLIPKDYRPHTGERVAVFGRWIVDAGHDDFQTEIHPPFLIARAHQALSPISIAAGSLIPDPDTTYSTVIGRPYLTSQIFSYDNGKPLGLRAHVLKAIKDKISSLTVALGGGDDNDYISASPVILPGWASSISYQNVSGHDILTGVSPVTMSYNVRPLSPRRALGDTLLVSYSFIARTGVSVSVTKIDEDTGDYGIKVTISISAYAEPPIPQGQDTTIYVVDDKVNNHMSALPPDDTQLIQDFVDSKEKAIRDGTDPDVQHWYLTDWERNAIAEQLHDIVHNGVHMNWFDESSWPVPLSPLDKQYNGVKDVPADSLPLHRGGFAVDDEQPFPIYGYLEVHWKRA